MGLVHVDGSASTDGNGQPGSLVTYLWIEGDTIVGQGAATDVALPVGTHQLTLRVFNTLGEFSDSATTATVADTQPPVIERVTDSEACVWPPNDKLLLYGLGSQIQVQVEDVCDPAPTVAFIGGQVAESGRPPRRGPGRAPPSGVGREDLFLSANAFCVRAEEGNQYRIDIQATNAAGLSSNIVTTIVDVPTEEQHLIEQFLCRKNSTGTTTGGDSGCIGDGRGGGPSSGGPGGFAGQGQGRGGLGNNNGGACNGNGQGGADDGTCDNGKAGEGNPGGTSTPDGGGGPQCCTSLPQSDFLPDDDSLCDFGDGGIAVTRADGGVERPGPSCSTGGNSDGLLSLALIFMAASRRRKLR
jgi:MYXO-CTERM domain-containing protein